METVIAVELTAAEAQALADAVCAWLAGAAYLGPTDTDALQRANTKLAAAIDEEMPRPSE